MSQTKPDDMEQVREKLIEMYMEIAAGFYFEGSDSITERNDYAPEFADDVISLFKQQQTALLQRVREEIATAERMAWSNEDGSQMETRVFETNMKASLDALEGEL